MICPDRARSSSTRYNWALALDRHSRRVVGPDGCGKIATVLSFSLGTKDPLASEDQLGLTKFNRVKIRQPNVVNLTGTVQFLKELRRRRGFIGIRLPIVRNGIQTRHWIGEQDHAGTRLGIRIAYKRVR